MAQHSALNLSFFFACTGEREEDQNRDKKFHKSYLLSGVLEQTPAAFQIVSIARMVYMDSIMSMVSMVSQTPESLWFQKSKRRIIAFSKRYKLGLSFVGLAP